MSKAVAEIAAGVALIAVDVAVLGAIPPLIAAGAKLIIGGIGTLLTKQQTGLGLNTVNPIAPWNVVYGRAKVGGITVFQEETGVTNKYWHRVMVLACHRSQSIDAVYFDSKRVCLDTSGNSLSFGDSTAVIAAQQTVGIASISRVNNVVTVVMAGPMPLPASTAAGPALMDADTIQIQNVGSDATLNGQYQIQVLSPTTFTYICGGNPVTLSEGQVQSQWPDYGDTVHVEYALGDQTSNPFPGLVAAGDSGSNGLWTNNHALAGRTAAYVRMKYGGNTYQPGVPTIGFTLHGKNDVYDPRSGGNGYTENAALCIADYLTQQDWGFKCQYGADVPRNPLAAAANICDESVTLAAGGTEPRYTCNGSFQVTAKRGEILENLLTSCAGRLTQAAGQYVINPGAWIGTAAISGYAVTNATGSPAIAATLYVTTTHIPGYPSAYGCIAQDPAMNPIGLLQPRYWVNQSLPGTANGAWTMRTDTAAISASSLGGLQMAFGMAPPGGGDSIADQLLVYDCWVTVTFADGTGGTYRPSTASVSTSLGTAGSIANPGNAVDGNPTTAATISTLGTGTLDFSPLLIISAFNFPQIAGTSTALTFPQSAAGPFQWKPKVAVRDWCNGCKATYISPLNNWQASDAPPYAQDTNHGYPAPTGTAGYYDINVAADGGERRWKDIQLPFTISYSMAQRLMKITLMRSRQEGMGTFIYNLAMLQLTALDVIEMTVPFLGWTGKLLEVTRHRFTVNKGQAQDSDNGSVTLGTELDLQETDPSIYAWSTTEELSPEGYRQGQVSNIKTVEAPTGVTLANAPNNAGGISLDQVRIVWATPTDGYVVNGGQTIVQYSLDGANWTGLGTFDSSVTDVYIPNVAAGQTYYTRIAYINAAGIQGLWTTQGPLTATGSSLRRIDDEVPGGTVNGVNVAFTLALTPNPTTSLSLYLNGDLQLQGLDYTLSGTSITMTTPPLTGAWLRAFYWY